MISALVNAGFNIKWIGTLVQNVVFLGNNWHFTIFSNNDDLPLDSETLKCYKLSQFITF